MAENESKRPKIISVEKRLGKHINQHQPDYNVFPIYLVYIQTA
jgi:hypothetical protein